MDHLRGPGRLRFPVGNVDVGGNFGRLSPRLRDRGLILGAGQALPGRGQLLPVRRTGVPQHSKNFRFARMAKFVLGWGSHLYYWVYPGAMAATIGIMIGYIVGIFFPDTMNSGTPGPVFMAVVAVISAFGISYIAYSGVQASTVTNFAINAIQIVALLFFSVLAITYRSGIQRAPREWRSTAPRKCSITLSAGTLRPIPARGRSSRRMALTR